VELAIEVDGDSHFTVEAMQYDGERTAYMKQFGIEVVRFTNLEILECIRGVLETIEGAVKRRRTTSPSPPPLRRRGNARPVVKGGLE